MYSLNMKYKPILSELKISIEKEKPDWCMPSFNHSGWDTCQSSKHTALRLC